MEEKSIGVLNTKSVVSKAGSSWAKNFPETE